MNKVYSAILDLIESVKLLKMRVERLEKIQGSTRLDGSE